MKRFAAVLLVFCALFAGVCSEALAQQPPLYVELGLNKDVFYLGDYMFVYLNVGNLGFDVMVDVYLSLTTPDGTVLYAPGFAPLAHPYQTQVHIPGGGETGWFYHNYYQLPSQRLPLYEPGEYTFSLWFCAAGSSAQVTVPSTKSFRLVPCQLDSWVNDNYTGDIEVDEEGLWVGLENGVQYIPFDGSRRVTWHREDGAWRVGAHLFKGPDNTIIASNGPYGLSLYDSCGWRSVIRLPGATEVVQRVTALVVDAQDCMWLLWSSNYPQIVSCLTPGGELIDYGEQITGIPQGMCLTNDGCVCVASDRGLNIMYDGSFEFTELEWRHDRCYVTGAHGDARGNIWLEIEEGEYGTGYLLRYDLNADQAFTIDLPGPEIPDEILCGIASDSFGNVWFSTTEHLVKYDGSVFDSIDTSPFALTAIEVGHDGTVYCCSVGEGIRAYTGTGWVSYKDESPETRGGEYGYALGLSNGEAIILSGKAYPTFSGYEQLRGRSWEEVEIEGAPLSPVNGVYQGRTGLWAWTESGVHLQQDGTWIDASDGLSGDPIQGILEDDSGQAYLLADECLMIHRDDRWELLDSLPGVLSDYRGFMLDGSGRFYVFDSLGQGGRPCIHIRDETGNWSRIDEKNLGSYFANCGLSDAGLLYVGANGFIAVIDGNDVRRYSLSETGLLWQSSFGFIAFDLADRAWITAYDSDGGPTMLIHDPADDSFHELGESAHWIVPHNTSWNDALVNNMFDRSFGKYGTLWYPEYGPTRLNLAPQTRIMINRDLYGVGDTVQVAVHFANYAGSIAVDWYAAIEDMQGNRIFWQPNFETGESSWANVDVPAIRSIVVPTDTSFIIPFGTIMIPLHFMDGHYRWRSGFKRAGGDEWLGVGFPSYDEFCVVRPPTP